MPSTAPDVVAGVLLRKGEVLVAQRPRDPCRGKWEFPGGKVEPGEGEREALARELWEEVGVIPRSARPLIRFPAGSLKLSFWLVEDFEGEPSPREGQALRWVGIGALDDIALLAANEAVIRALRLPSRYLITPEPEDPASFLKRLERRLEGGIRLVQLRAKVRPLPKALLEEATALCRHHGARLMVNGDPDALLGAGVQGIHLPSAALMALSQRPPFPWVAASCHHPGELMKAQAIGVDFAVLSPVLPTQSHPSKPLGWSRFEALASRFPFPIYALGGMGEAHLREAQWRGGQGIAAIRGLW